VKAAAEAAEVAAAAAADKAVATAEAWKAAKAELAAFSADLKERYGHQWRTPPDDAANMKLIQLESGERKAGRAKVTAERAARVAEEEAEEAKVRVEVERRERVAAKLARLGKS